MIKVNLYIKLQEVLSRVLRHPMLKDVTLEDAILYTVDFISAVGVPDMYEDREAIIDIENFRGLLPCDLIAVKQVKNIDTGICLKSMTDSFLPEKHKCGCGHSGCIEEQSFKIQNSIIICSFEYGQIKISYLAIPIDEDGYPLIINNPTYLKALELYIKLEVFTYKFDEGKILAGVLLNTQTLYAWKVGQLLSEMTIPSESEMESICRSWCTLIQRTNDFLNGWKDLGNKEHIRRH